MKCPNCGKEVKWDGNPYRPFCCEKCKLADLSKWLNEEYSIEEELLARQNDQEGDPRP
jgi:endogenous inhibitor of DNA gyrase (YacG/DUF329 family)